MTYDKIGNQKRRWSQAKIRSIVIAVAVSVLFVVALINFVSMLVEYNEMQAKKEMLLEEINDTKDNIESCTCCDDNHSLPGFLITEGSAVFTLLFFTLH